MPRFYLIFLIFFLTTSGTIPCAIAGKKKQQPKEETVRFKGVDVDSLIRTICNEKGTSRIGGIWTATNDGATVGIVQSQAWSRITGTAPPDKERNMAEQWVIVLLDSPDPILQPGTLMGWLSPSAKRNYYNAYIFTKREGNHLAKSRHFILHLIDDGHMTMKAIRKGIEINPWRFLPYMIRGSIRYRDETPRDLDGFLKKWPTPHNPHTPRYL